MPPDSVTLLYHSMAWCWSSDSIKIVWNWSLLILSKYDTPAIVSQLKRARYVHSLIVSFSQYQDYHKMYFADCSIAASHIFVMKIKQWVYEFSRWIYFFLHVIECCEQKNNKERYILIIICSFYMWVYMMQGVEVVWWLEKLAHLSSGKEFESLVRHELSSLDLSPKTTQSKIDTKKCSGK